MSHPPQNGAKHRRQGKHRAHDGHRGSALPGRDDVSNDGLDQDQQAAAAQPLNGSGHDQPGHVGGQATEQASGHENRHRGDEQRLASQQVAELSVHRHHHRSRQDVGGRHPQHAVHPAEFADDGRQSGGEHGLIQFRQQETKHQPDEEQGGHPLVRRCPRGRRSRAQRCFADAHREHGAATCCMRVGSVRWLRILTCMFSSLRRGTDAPAPGQIGASGYRRMFLI